jgi:glycosyltransferase involved in cell wall biosynthesis
MGLKILMAIDHYPPIIGGAERQTQLLSRKLVCRGHEVSVATVWQNGLREREDECGVIVNRLKGLMTRIPWFFKDPDWRRHPPPFPDPGLVISFRQIINKFQPDVIQVYGWIVYSCAAALIGKKIPLIVSSRDYGYSCANRWLIRHGQICDGPHLVKCLECTAHYYGFPKAFIAVSGIYSFRGLLIRKTYAFHSVSHFIQKVVQRDLLRNRNHIYSRDRKLYNVVIHNPIFRYDESAEKTFLDCLPNEPFILFVGTLDRHKGLNLLLEAYKQLISPPPLVLIGISTPNTPTSFPTGVIVFRDVSHPNVMAAWEHCLFGVVPSLLPDSLPNVVLEAMSKGKAIIGTNAGGIPDMIVDNETGLLVPLGDVNSLAYSMVQLIEDTEKRNRLGKAARDHIEKFNEDVIVDQFEELYRQLVIK